jgi:acyl dehydratase
MCYDEPGHPRQEPKNRGGAMTDETSAEFRAQLDAYVGQPTGSGGPAPAPDEVNLPMIRHWVDAIDDQNPVYLDAEFAAKTRFGGIVAPPAMLQTWTMGRPQIQGIAERGGANSDGEMRLLGLLDKAGYTSIVATNSELEFERYLRLGDRLQSSTVFESVSDEKTTARGRGYFVTWVTTYVDADEKIVGRQRFRVFKFKPAKAAGATS